MRDHGPAISAHTATDRPASAWILLPRHGARPLGFHGRLLLDASNRDAGSFTWSEIAVYEPDTRTPAARATTWPSYVVAVRHHTGEHAAPVWQHAVACTDAAAVHAFLRTHDPIGVMPSGMAAAAATVAGADALLAAVQEAIRHQRRGWQTLLANVLAPTPALAGPENPYAPPTES